MYIFNTRNQGILKKKYIYEPYDTSVERIIKLKEAYHYQEASFRGWLREYQLLEENRLNFGDPLNHCQGVIVESLMKTSTLTMLISLGFWLLSWTPVFWAPVPGAL